MAKKKRLGRGLDALLSKPAQAAGEIQPAESKVSEINRDQLKKLPVEWLQRGAYQPRLDVRPESLEELADSIRSQGVVQPIVVRPVRDGAADAARYEIIAGERRWRAAQIAGLADIPAVIRDVDDESAIAMALIENIQRENLNPLEEARALQRLVDEFGLTHEEAAAAVGRSRAAVSNLLRLLDLGDRVKAMLEKREIEMGHARALLALDEKRQFDAAREVVRKGLSVRATERLVRRLADGKPAKKAGTSEPGADIRRLETDISDKLGAKVRIAHAAKGHGKVVISYNSLDELDGILQHIN